MRTMFQRHENEIIKAFPLDFLYIYCTVLTPFSKSFVVYIDMKKCKLLKKMSTENRMLSIETKFHNIRFMVQIMYIYRKRFMCYISTYRIV